MLNRQNSKLSRGHKFAGSPVALRYRYPDGDGSDSVYCEMLAVHPNGDTGELLGSGCGNDEQAAAKDCYDDATRRATE